MISKTANIFARSAMSFSVTFSLLALLVSIQATTSEAAPSDHDGDGLSDPTLITIETDQTLQWQSWSSQSQQLLDLGSFGVAGDHVVMSRWTATTTSEMGVVSKTSNGLLWELNAATGLQSFQHGESGDVVVAGGDFNGNGAADAAVVTRKRSAAEWRVRLDPGQGGSEILTARFGRWRDQAFSANIGGGADFAGSYTRRKRGRPTLRFYDFNTQTKTSVVRLPARVGRLGKIRPEPIANPNGIDDLVFARKRGRTALIYVYSAAGRLLLSQRNPVDGDIVVGNYATDAGEEIAIQNGTTLTVVNPYSGSISELTIPTGILVDEINIKAMAEDGNSEKEENKASKEAQAPSKCRRIVSFPSSHIYKTIGSTHFSPGDVRRNTIGLIIKPGGSGPFPSCVYALDGDGNEVARLGLYERGGMWAARYYAGIGCGSSTPYNGSKVAQNAREKTRSNEVYFQFESVCYGPIDASRCQGSSQC